MNNPTPAYRLAVSVLVPQGRVEEAQAVLELLRERYPNVAGEKYHRFGEF